MSSYNPGAVTNYRSAITGYIIWNLNKQKRFVIIAIEMYWLKNRYTRNKVIYIKESFYSNMF